SLSILTFFPYTTLFRSFGFKEIAFFSESFNSDSTQSLITKPMSLLEDSQAVGFQKASLEVCEQIEEDTEIDYFITAGVDPLLPRSEEHTSELQSRENLV